MDVDDDDFGNDDAAFEEDVFADDNDDIWGDDDELCYDEQKRIDHDEKDCEAIIQTALEKQRLAQSKLESCWKCDKCYFLLVSISVHSLCLALSLTLHTATIRRKPSV